jgi:hypothetical protein
MSCSFDRGIIQKYVDNTIDPLEFIFLKEHINYCGECKQELDLVMTLENELSKLFDVDNESEGLDLLISKLIDDCMEEVEKRKKLKYAINKGIEIGGRIVNNTTRFVEFIPGSKSMSKGVKKTAAATGGLFKTLMKKEVKRLFASVRY